MSQHPQTAAQHNSPQLGQVDITIAEPFPLEPATPADEVKKVLLAEKDVPIQTEQWSVRELRLPTEQAIAAIEANAQIPDEDKAWLIRKVNKTGFAGVIVNAHDHFHHGQVNFVATISKLY